MKAKLEKIKIIVQKELECSAHDFDHVIRVYNLCLNLADGLDVDHEVLEPAAILHDIARIKEDNDNTGNTDHAILGAEMAKQILAYIEYPTHKIDHIYDCIRSHRYRTGHQPESLEAKILFDADKCDTLGAIGIARSFVWVGRNNAKIYNNVDLEEYIQDNLGGNRSGRIQDKTKHSPQIELQTKLQFLSEKLHTSKAKELCKERLDYYKNFLNRLELEVNGDL